MSTGGDRQLSGSRRPRKRDAERIANVPPDTQIVLTVTLAGPPLPDVSSAEPISREELAQQYGATDDTVATATRVLEGLGLQVEASSALTRTLRVSGTASQIEQIFSPGLGIYRDPEQGEFRAREGELHIPAALDGIVTGVFGLDQRRVARRRLGASSAALTAPVSPAQLAAHYDFPSGGGAGQTVAIAEFGGGYFSDDLSAFCAKQGTTVPEVTPVGVNGASVLTLAQIQSLPPQQREQQLDESVEVNMDVQIVAGLAPDATQIVYFSSFDEQGWVELINQVIEGQPAPATTLSVSWGLAEDDPDWSAGAVAAIDERLQAAAALGITVCVAAGDDGSADQLSDGRAHVDFPASTARPRRRRHDARRNVRSGVVAVARRAHRRRWRSDGRRSEHDLCATELAGRQRRVRQRRHHRRSRHPRRRGPGGPALLRPDLYGQGLTQRRHQRRDSNLGVAAGGDGGGCANALETKLRRAAAGRERAGWWHVGAAGCTDITSGDNDSSTLGKGYKADTGFDAVSGWGVPNGMALLAALSGAAKPGQ